MSTAVKAGGKSFGSGAYSIYVPRQEVHNLDLADKRRTHLLISGTLILVGSVFFGFGSIRRSSLAVHTTDTRKCPSCAELVKIEAKICKHCGKELPEFIPESAPTIANAESLHDAAWNGNWATVKRLLEQGTDVNQTNADGNTALDLARRRGDKLIANLLISYGAVERKI